ncbi:hypothetical protein LMG28614_07331 [Paraburkholderia ultramafica]|uniref:Uncharacterized protein n=1 Tax=Paraburkholderia ultramafica TaxID=1544867 RepID=A0A6S7BR29_9BURK|nr:hypothetical protein LMG28614_07331 [Paraburkholderia ultramafica]
MRDGGRELAHGGHAVGVRQFCLHRAIAPLAPAGLFLRPFALGQIEHERDAFLPSCFESRPTDHDGHATAVFPVVLLFEGLYAPRCPDLS